MRKLAPAYIVILLDQLSKLKIRGLHYGPEDFPSGPFFYGILKFKFLENPGLAFGIGVGSLGWLLLIVTVLITSYIFYYLLMGKNFYRYESLALSFILGGAIGNLIDRSFTLFNLFGYNGVIDFIDLGFGNSFRWPYIFNLADMSVSIGIIIFITCSLFNSKTNELDNENT